MHETPSRDRGYGRATGQPSRGTAGLGSEAHFFSTSQGELVLSLPKEHPRTPGVQLCKTGGRRRQGSLRRNAHPEPLPSFGQRKASRAFHHIPPQRPGLGLHYQCCDYAPTQTSLPRITQSRLETAPTAFFLTEPTTRREGRPCPRSQQVILAWRGLESQHQLVMLCL